MYVVKTPNCFNFCVFSTLLKTVVAHLGWDVLFERHRAHFRGWSTYIRGGVHTLGGGVHTLGVECIH